MRWLSLRCITATASYLRSWFLLLPTFHILQKEHLGEFCYISPDHHWVIWLSSQLWGWEVKRIDLIWGQPGLQKKMLSQKKTKVSPSTLWLSFLTSHLWSQSSLLIGVLCHLLVAFLLLPPTTVTDLSHFALATWEPSLLIQILQKYCCLRTLSIAVSSTCEFLPHTFTQITPLPLFISLFKSYFCRLSPWVSV